MRASSFATSAKSDLLGEDGHEKARRSADQLPTPQAAAAAPVPGLSSVAIPSAVSDKHMTKICEILLSGFNQITSNITAEETEVSGLFFGLYSHVSHPHGR